MTPIALVLSAIYDIQTDKKKRGIDPSYCLRSELFESLKTTNLKEDAIDEHLETFVRLEFIVRGRTINDEYYMMTNLGVERIKAVM